VIKLRYRFEQKERAMHEPENLEAVLANIRSALERHQGQSKSGAILHAIITQAAPDLNIRSVVEIPTGPGALSKFIETYLNEFVKRIGNKGGDILYGIGDGFVSPPYEGASPLEDVSKVWKAFVSPNAVNHLFLNMSDLRLVVTETTLQDDGLEQIARVSDEEHDTIRQGFRKTLSEEHRSFIDEQTVNNASYETLLQALRSAGLMKSWSSYRRDAFKQLLAERLELLPLDKALIPSVAGQLIASQQALFRQKEITQGIKQPPPTNRSSETSAALHYDDINFVRDLARRAIDQMSYNDIRSICLPIGAIIDALSARK
jgi:hypothetical protein